MKLDDTVILCPECFKRFNQLTDDKDRNRFISGVIIDDDHCDRCTYVVKDYKKESEML